MATAPLSPDQLLSAAAHCIPPLSFNVTAECCVAIVGGSADLTGPPGIAAMAALRAGASRVHVVCAAEAAPAVRVFSPELIVHPVLDVADTGDQLHRLFDSRMPLWQAVLVGPGLGDCSASCRGAALAIELARSANKPLVIDGDGLSLVAGRPELIAGYNRVLLTPNAFEFGRIYQSVQAGQPMQRQTDDTHSSRQLVSRLAANLAGPCVLLKGREDVLAVLAPPSGKHQQQLQLEICALQGCGRNCFGQDAILSGLALVFSHWCFSAASDASSSSSRQPTTARQPALLAGYAASALARRCGAQAFAAKRRATLATDQLDQIGTAFSRLFPEADCGR